MGSTLGDIFQSPLHRGLVFNRYLFRSRHGASVFQSPLHRGLVFNEKTVTRGRGGRRISVPSSSGTRVQLFLGQSSHRSHIGISVPSSSGTRVQQYGDDAGIFNVYHFSPLFIGDSCSTKWVSADTGEPMPISVPSSSGTRVQQEPEGDWQGR